MARLSLKMRTFFASLTLTLLLIGIAKAAVSGKGEAFVEVSKTDRLVLKSKQTTLELFPNCKAVSPQYGKGSWAWANGGYIVTFKSKQFGFPRQEIELMAQGKCQM